MEHLKYSTGLKRIGAAIVDNIVFWPLALFGEKLYSLNMPAAAAMTWNHLLMILPVAYSVYCHYRYGMTIGKWVAKIKVIDVSETKDISLRYVSWITIVSSSAWLIWFLLEIISMLTNPKRRAIHDFIAGTVVVRTDVFERSKLINESFNNADGQ